MTTRVYDHNNTLFEVSDARAAELVLNHGWTRQPTTTVPVDTPPAEPVVDDWRLDVTSEDDEDDLDILAEETAAEYAEALNEPEPTEPVRPTPARRRRK